MWARRRKQHVKRLLWPPHAQIVTVFVYRSVALGKRSDYDHERHGDTFGGPYCLLDSELRKLEEGHANTDECGYGGSWNRVCSQNWVKHTHTTRFIQFSASTKKQQPKSEDRDRRISKAGGAVRLNATLFAASGGPVPGPTPIWVGVGVRVWVALTLTLTLTYRADLVSSSMAHLDCTLYPGL